MVPCLIVGLSFIRAAHQTPSQRPANIAHNAFIVRIKQTPIQGPRSHRTTGEVIAIRTRNPCFL